MESFEDILEAGSGERREREGGERNGRERREGWDRKEGTGRGGERRRWA